MSGGRSFTNVFPDLDNCKCENFLQPWQDMHLKIKSRPVYRIMEGFILEVYIGKRSKVVSRSVFCHVDPDLRVLILYLKSLYLNREFDKDLLHTMLQMSGISCKTSLLLYCLWW